MQFTRAKKHSSLSLSTDGTSVTLRATAVPRFGKTALAAVPCHPKDGVTYTWSVRVDDNQGGVVAVGVALPNTNLARAIGKTESPRSSPTSWAYYSKAPPGNAKGKSAKRSRNVWGKYGGPFRTGDVISCQLDTNAGTLRFFRNFEDMGVAFRGLKGMTLYPAVSLHKNGQRVSLLAADSLAGDNVPKRLKGAVEGIEAAAYRTVRQGEALCQEIRDSFDALREELARKEEAALKEVVRRQEGRLLQLWRQCGVLKAHSEYKASGKDVERGPWPQEWVASGPDSTVEVEEIEEVGEVPASGAAVEDGEGDELEEEDAGEGQDSATGAVVSPPVHLAAVTTGEEPLECVAKSGRVLVLVGQTELGKLRDASRKAESALKAAEKLKASLAKVKASRKALEMQIKRQNPLTPLDLILTDELVVRQMCKQCSDTTLARSNALPTPPPASFAPSHLDRLNIFAAQPTQQCPAPLGKLTLPEPSDGIRRLLGNFSGYKLWLVEANLISWVEQRSPACAAACVAGAFNAVKPPDCPARLLQQHDVMEYYQAHWRAEVVSAHRLLENFFGTGVDLGPLEDALTACGLASGGKAPESRVLEVLRTLSTRAAECGASSVAAANGGAGGRGLRRAGSRGACERSEVRGGEGEREGAEEEGDAEVKELGMDEEEEDEGGEEGEVGVLQVADLQPSIQHRPLWDALAAKLEKAPKRLASLAHGWCSKAGALHKLTKEKPSTGPVGTDRLIAAIRATFEKEHVDAQVWRLAGGAGKKRHQVVMAAHRLPFPATALNIDALQQISRRGHPSFIQISENDQPEAVARQWEELLTTLTKEACCIVYHLENHYCLLYGAREWSVDVGYSGTRTVRQILVSKPGQRPCSWIDFEAARNTMLRWAGYCMVGVQALGWNPPEQLEEAGLGAAGQVACSG